MCRQIVAQSVAQIFEVSGLIFRFGVSDAVYFQNAVHRPVNDDVIVRKGLVIILFAAVREAGRKYAGRLDGFDNFIDQILRRFRIMQLECNVVRNLF